MASVKVAVRVRPFNQREIEMGSNLIIKMEEQKTSILNSKLQQSSSENSLGRERIKEFTYDFSYWSFDSSDPHYASQEQVFEDIGKDVVDSAFEGYNACIFAYGQTGSGKTFTMMGTPDSEGLTPRICEALFARMKSSHSSGMTFRTEVSYMEIYNERVKDLLRKGAIQQNLRVREHPKLGPYVQDLSKHLVMDYSDVQELMNRGNTHRTTAATAMNEVSSRSHAIFTLTFSQASFNKDMPSETVSKVNLVDLAGSERANATGASGQRLKEGGHINKSLVTLGSVISALADMCTAPVKKQVFIPYRDSVLTWLLRDSLGGNSKTVMIATISPAECNYGETLSTLRYANRAKNILNTPTINEDPNVKLIRNLRSEIERLKALLNDTTSVSSATMIEKLHENEARVKVLTEEWTEKWKETHKILKEQRTLGLRKSGLGVVLDSELPHLVGIDDDLLSTGITLYHLKEGKTLIGTCSAPVKQDIVLNGVGIEDEHCVIELKDGVATLIPVRKAQCYVNTILIDKPTRLSQGCVILLGRTSVFRYNDPSEVEQLRKEKEHGSTLTLSRLSLWSRSMSDLARSIENLCPGIPAEKEVQTSCDFADEENNRGILEAEEQQDDKEVDGTHQQEPKRTESDIVRVPQEELIHIFKSEDKENEEADKEKEKLFSEWKFLRDREQEVLKEFNQKGEALLRQKSFLEWKYDEIKLQVELESKQLELLQKELDVVRKLASQEMLGEEKDEEKVDAAKSVRQSMQEQWVRQLEGTVANKMRLLEDKKKEMHSLSVQISKEKAIGMTGKKEDETRKSNLGERRPSEGSLPLKQEQMCLPCDGPTTPEECWPNTWAASLNHCSHSPAKPTSPPQCTMNDHITLRESMPPSNDLQNDLEGKIQFAEVQDELDLLRREFETSQRSNSTIDLDSLRLCEMEQQHKIEYLVEQEVERRLLQEQRLQQLQQSDENKRRLNRPRPLSWAGSLSPSTSSCNFRRVDLSLDDRDNRVRIYIPSYAMRGSGSSAHYEYEVKIFTVEESWTIFRRYKRFWELHQYMKQKYGSKVHLPYFPPKKIFGSRSEKVVEERKKYLEVYLQQLVQVCSSVPGSPLHVPQGQLLRKYNLYEFAPFFRKGCFETSKHGTG